MAARQQAVAPEPQYTYTASYRDKPEDSEKFMPRQVEEIIKGE